MRIRGADVAIVGAGAVGASVAFHLASRGMRVFVLDRRGIAAGATGASAGFVRVYHSAHALTRLAHESLPEFAGWHDLVGGSIDFVRTGCVHELPPGTDPDRVSETSDAVGTHWETARASHLRTLFPALRWPDESLAIYEPGAGYASPALCAEQYLRRLIDLGGTVWTGVTVLRLSAKHGRVSGVVTNAGVVSADVVIVATGPWFERFPLVDLPVNLTTKRIVTQRVWLQEPMPRVPAYINEGTDPLFFRPDGPSELLVGGEEGESGEHPDKPRFPNEVLLLDVRRRVQSRTGGPVVGMEVISGLDLYTPDGLPIIDRCPGIGGAYLATGFSGAGFKTAPAVGRLVGEWIATDRRDDMLEPFSASRFERPPRPRGPKRSPQERAADP